MSWDWWLELEDGSRLGHERRMLTFVDCHRARLDAFLADDEVHALLLAIAEDDHGVILFPTDPPVVITHIRDGQGAGGHIVYVHTWRGDRALAPIYMSAAERVKLANIVRTKPGGFRG